MLYTAVYRGILVNSTVKVVTSHVGTQANKQVERLLGVSLVHIAIHDRT
ncbi:hypothetical protein VCHA40P238_10329 [Vibrio chagasii]|nr:hypothetical protein VCHA40P238_10329 [Vibrio chagasii]